MNICRLSSRVLHSLPDTGLTVMRIYYSVALRLIPQRENCSFFRNLISLGQPVEIVAICSQKPFRMLARDNNLHPTVCIVDLGLFVILLSSFNPELPTGHR
jgi:hypothetical protein